MQKHVISYYIYILSKFKRYIIFENVESIYRSSHYQNDIPQDNRFSFDKVRQV